MIVTFDKSGISGHPNHIQTHLGVAKVFEQGKFRIDVLTLTTVNFLRKYLGYADIHLNTNDEMNYVILTPYHSYRSMMQHHSQFVWFRKLFTIFSRYAYFNSFSLYSHEPEKYRQKTNSSKIWLTRTKLVQMIKSLPFIKIRFKNNTSFLDKRRSNKNRIGGNSLTVSYLRIKNMCEMRQQTVCSTTISLKFTNKRKVMTLKTNTSRICSSKIRIDLSPHCQ